MSSKKSGVECVKRSEVEGEMGEVQSLAHVGPCRPL